MSTPAPPPDSHRAARSHPQTESRAKVPLRTTWPRLKMKVSEELLRETMEERFGYHPHDWQVEAALKVLEGNDGIVLGAGVHFAPLQILQPTIRPRNLKTPPSSASPPLVSSRNYNSPRQLNEHCTRPRASVGTTHQVPAAQ